MLRFQKLTFKARETAQSAQDIAARHENQYIKPVLLLAAQVARKGGVVPHLVTKVGIRPEALSQVIHRAIARLTKVRAGNLMN